MSKLAEARDGVVIAFVGVATAGMMLGIIVCLGYMWNNTVGTWLNDILTVTPQEAADASYKRQLELEDQKRETEAALKDPSSQASVAKACIERGGIPRYSNWDGEIFKCEGEKK